MQTRDDVEGLFNFREFSQPSSCLDEAKNTEKVLCYCLCKIILQNTRKSETSQPCLHKHLSANESARSGSVILQI